MARYPGAVWRPLTVDKSRWRLVPLRMNLHVAVSEAASLFGYFNGARSRPDSHFYVRRDGTVEQYVDTSLVAYADLEGNGSTISIETQGGVTATQTQRWTAAQVESMARIYAWAIRTHGIARRIADDSRPGNSSRGLSWHRLGIDGNFPGRPLHGRVSGGRKYSRAFGKVCPGDAKIRQIPDVYARAMEILDGNATRDPVGDVLDTQIALAVLSYYDPGDSLEWLDNVPGPAFRAAVTQYQTDRPHALAADGWFGPASDTYLREHDMSKILDQIRAAVRAELTDRAGYAVWSYRNERVEDHDIYQIVRQVRDLAVSSAGERAGLLEAISQVSGGAPVDLDAITAAAEKGVAEAVAGLEADVNLTIGTGDTTGE